MASRYYKGGHKVMLGGAPCRLATKPHAAMLAAMRAAQTPSLIDKEGLRDRAALEYALWLVHRDGLVVPETTVADKHGCGVRPVVITDWLYVKDWGSKERVRAVEWQEGVWRRTRTFMKWRTRKGVRVQVEETEDCWRNPWWECEAVVLRVEIPHWDWIQPHATELTRHATTDYMTTPQRQETHASGQSRSASEGSGVPQTLGRGEQASDRTTTKATPNCPAKRAGEAV